MAHELLRIFFGRITGFEWPERPKKGTGLGRGGRGESEKTPALQIGFY